MLKKTITYTGFDGEEYTEDFYFNISKSELVEMHLSVEGGLDVMLRNILNAKDVPELSKFFKRIITMSYGRKSPDGKRFEKSEQISNEFTQTKAYDTLFMELLLDAKKAADFINSIMPIELVKEITENEELNTDVND